MFMCDKGTTFCPKRQPSLLFYLLKSVFLIFGACLACRSPKVILSAQQTFCFLFNTSVLDVKCCRLDGAVLTCGIFLVPFCNLTCMVVQLNVYSYPT